MEITREMIYRLQKAGEYGFEGLTREASRAAAEELARAAQAADQRAGISCRYGIQRNAFGYYRAVRST